MKKNFYTALLLASCLSISSLLPLDIQAATSNRAPQQQISYQVTFDNAVHHEAIVTATFQGIKPKNALELRMARSSPGRYALHEFAKNVYNVSATDSKGKPLDITRPNPHQWNVADHDGTVIVTYTLYANRPDGTYAGVSSEHAHLNAPATFMYANGFEDAPARVNFKLPAGSPWSAATQLKREEGWDLAFTAPNFQYLMDSPTELAELQWREWTVQDQGQDKKIRIGMHHNGTKAELDEYTEKAKKIAEQARAVFGEFPSFDFGEYTFIACYMPTTPGDGMEHRNSTSITSSRPLKTGMIDNLGTLSHEFFHAWNVERIRPKSLEPFNFAEANMSGELWLAEGFTNYYGALIMHRAGVTDQARFLKGASAEIGAVLFLPGKEYFSPVEMSQQAPFVDAARSVDPVNRQNTYISYYTYGSAIGYGLDMTLRTRFKDITLDDYMRLLWQRHGKPEKAYTLPDLEKALADLTKDQSFAQEFFRRYVYGKELMPYESLLKDMGFVLRSTDPTKAVLGWEPLRFEKEQAIIQSGTFVNSPLYKAGLEEGDAILSVNGKKMKDQKTLSLLLAQLKPGKNVQLEVMQDGLKKQVTLTLAQDPEIELVPVEKAGGTLSPEVQARREAWLNSKSI